MYHASFNFALKGFTANRKKCELGGSPCLTPRFSKMSFVRKPLIDIFAEQFTYKFSIKFWNFFRIIHVTCINHLCSIESNAFLKSSETKYAFWSFFDGVFIEVPKRIIAPEIHLLVLTN